MTTDSHLGGAAWTLLSFVAIRSVALVSTVWLAHLLSPSDIGVVAVATIVVTAAAIVSGLGLAPAIIGSNQNDRDLRATFGLLLIGGVVGSCIVTLAAGPIANVIDAGRLRNVLPVLSLTLIAFAVTAFYGATINRALLFRRRFVADLTRAIVYGVLAVGAAVAGAGVWSLVIGQVGAAAVEAIVTFALAPVRMAPSIDRAAAARALVSGGGYLANGVAEHVEHSLDTLAVALTRGPQATGFYSMAYGVSFLPYQAFTHPVATAAFPIIARSHREHRETSDLGLELLGVATFFACPGGVLLSALAYSLLPLLLGQSWAPAAPVLAVLGIWSAVLQITASLGWFLIATNDAGASAKISGLNAAVTAPLLLLAADRYGVVGAASVMLGGAVFTTALLALHVRRRHAIGLRRQLAAVDAQMIAAVVAWLAARGTSVVMDHAPSWLTLVVGGTLGVVAYLATVRIVRPEVLSLARGFSRGVVNNLLGRETMPT